MKGSKRPSAPPSIEAIVVGARDSLLSIRQFEEVYEELKSHHPYLVLKPIFVKTTGDVDQKTSLRTLDKTDFFTKEIDQMLLQGKCRIAIHSAKDLPDPLPKGLKIAALTKGVDPSDSLVLREKETLESLPTFAKIATSSLRREESVRLLRQDLVFVDIRGTIEKRYEKLIQKEVDGLVIATAALIRLNMKVNKIILKGETAPLQGRLAILAREEDHAMCEIFQSLHCC